MLGNIEVMLCLWWLLELLSRVRDAVAHPFSDEHVVKSLRVASDEGWFLHLYVRSLVELWHRVTLEHLD